MILLTKWLQIRERIDRYFRTKCLQPGKLRVSGAGALHIDIEDISSSESAKVARRASYFVLSPGHRPKVAAEDVTVMRRSLDDGASVTWVGHVCRSFDGRLFLELEPKAADALGWAERDRIGFRRLYSGELLTFVDRRARAVGA